MTIREETVGKWISGVIVTLTVIAFFGMVISFVNVLKAVGEQNRIERETAAVNIAWMQAQLDGNKRLAAISAMLAEDEQDLDLIRRATAKPADPVKCLTDNIYFEAGFEPEEGQLAVAQVTLNRAHDNKRNICSVVYYKKVNPQTHKKEAAFSWTLGKKWRPKGINREHYNECQQIAKAVLTKGLRSDIIDDTVTYYHATYVNPRWAKSREMVAQIGQHVFYR